jgi:hypothetical protein
MRTIIILFATALLLHGGILRVSKVAPIGGLNTEAIRYTEDGRTMILNVEVKALVTGKDVKKASVVPGRKGVIAVELNDEGAKRLADGTKGAAGMLRLAVIVEGRVESIPLVQGQLGDKFWISGLEDRGEGALKELVEALMNAKDDEDAPEAPGEKIDEGGLVDPFLPQP